MKVFNNVVKSREITPINIGNYSEVTDDSIPNAVLYSSITEEIYTYISDAQAIEFTIDYSGTQLKITSYFCSKANDTYSFYGIAETNGIKIPVCVFIKPTQMNVIISA